MGINNPIPRSLGSETKKAAKILSSFVKPNQVFGADQVIPPDVLKKAKGLAIITVLKAGFLFSGRAGSGVIVARLGDGTWSAPSAIAMAGAGAGGLVGIELTDFVFILNTPEAVKSFSEFGTITLGGNISVSAGPLGRNAEAAASASTGGVSAVFAYSKSKGLFAGVSVEGSVIVERREANRKFYGDNCKTKQILSGRIRPPPEVDPLFRVLESRAFNYRTQNYDDQYSEGSFYDDIPDSFSEMSSRRNGGSGRYGRGGNRSRSNSYYDDDDDDFDDDYNDSGSNDRNRNNNTSSRTGGVSRNDSRYRSNVSSTGGRTRRSYGGFDDEDFDDPSGANDYYASHRRTGSANNNNNSRSRWEDDVYDGRSGNRSSRRDEHDVDDLSNRFSRSRISSGPTGSKRYSDERQDTKAPISSAGSEKTPKAVALYSFKGEESGDLPFRKGDVITILKKSDSQDDWWTGRVNGNEGIFPANYVELV
ncbi:similar to Saccharomyces cerevisiae YHR016C YSC84 Actin-binding protein involved in bundling of actin filaments and endocytosis of actin cortical patches [Maudiozyma saulgeensis]|uniref:Similar to Saccharomyces cerevisiae YHR016C YSC84 Actin-binding protein involved in bundling of actin filaments and endocytosis of actin cortical patches n=1 Tax=Maudiozyma saulgeensis TaxID=1789683 RepID=A0A1X7R1C8_9SACH|nr:similar to Saccharomyces cerevisiae YHR016C YSC84 Actin-binding protein involved in bundling of actin filaments and endocytosis of actin cortical patches [Kazachstania saulgeensis]